MKEIKIHNGGITILDDEDFEKLSIYTYYKNNKGYVYRNGHGEDKGKAFYLHREIMNAPRGMYVDHINHDKLDNRKENLRLVTAQQNQFNLRKTKNKKTSKYKGVCWVESKKGWLSTTNLGNKHITIGLFYTEDAAAIAYNEYIKPIHGEFAHLNDVPFNVNWESKRIPDRKNGTGKSKYIGVSYRPRYDDWIATIRIEGKSTYLGTFKDEVEAAKAYNKAAIKHRGNKAKLNDV